MTDSPAGYVLGHTDRELRRLAQQAAFFADATRAGLLRAGLVPGLRVVDLGCGIGDVSFIASELVGEAGHVTGLDISAVAIAAARRRAAAGDFAVDFVEGRVEDFARFAEFDAVIGRFILLHVADPGALIGAIAARCRRPGARIAFIEMDMGTTAATAAFPLLDTTLTRIREVYARMGLSADAGTRLYPAFRAAGLSPELYAYTRVGGSSDLAGFAFLEESVRSLAPAMEKLGIADAATLAVETLAGRLAAEAAAADAAIFYPRVVAAWATV